MEANQGKRRTASLTCFTGSLALLLSEYAGSEIKEQYFLEKGEGYLFRTTRDEYGFPEYSFNAFKTAPLALSRMGVSIEKAALGSADLWREYLIKLISSGSEPIVWVNSAHLNYAPVYSSRPGHLHAIIIRNYDGTKDRFEITDPLIVERFPYALDANLSGAKLGEALYTKIPGGEIVKIMGTVFFFAGKPIARESNTARSDLLDQCNKFLSHDEYRRAIGKYKEDCSEHFSGTIDNARYAAHRIFDHINVLFVLPCVKHLKESLGRGGFSPGLVDLVDQLSFEWSKLAIIALKFEATLDRAAIGRMNDTFDTLAYLTDQFWLAVEQDGRRKNV